jgi:hypothetical protein
MMGSVLPPPPNGKINFAGMVGPKRRRMRSGGNVSTLTNNSTKSSNINNYDEEDDDDDAIQMDTSIMEDGDTEKTAQTSKCKGATTIPIFLKSES